VTTGGAGDALNLKLRTPEGEFSAVLRVPPAPMRLAELALSFMGLSGKLTDMAVARETRDGAKEVSCRKGCGACCRQPVPLSPPEAWLIADIVAGLPPARQAPVREAFAAADEVFTRSTLKQRLLGPMDALDRMKELAFEYFSSGVPCPFLVDEACSIHPVRPSICREYLVTSPPEYCARPGSGPVERIPVGVRLSEALANLTGKLLGKPAEVVPLVFALEWAEANRADGERTWEARSLIEGLVGELSH
jgi:Fe-S-cluster containining protein